MGMLKYWSRALSDNTSAVVGEWTDRDAIRVCESSLHVMVRCECPELEIVSKRESFDVLLQACANGWGDNWQGT